MPPARADRDHTKPRFDLVRQIACIERELRLRRRVYPRWVEDKRLTGQEAEDEILAMEAVLATLKEVKTAGEPEQLAMPLE